MGSYGSADAGRGAPVVLGTEPALEYSGFSPREALAPPTPEQEEPPHRVLVLGSKGHARAVDSYAWHELPDDLHVGDYTVVLLDLTPLGQEDYRQQIDRERLPSWEQWTRALWGRTSIIAIGQPWLRFADDLDAYYWLPYRPTYTVEGGREVAPVEDEQLAAYMAAVRRWDYYWEPSAAWHNCDEGRLLAAVHPALQHCKLRVEPLVTTTFGKSLVVRITYSADIVPSRVAQGQTFTGDIPTSTGLVYLLPPTTEWSSHDAIAYWLRTLGVATEHEAPEWSAQFALPAEAPLAARETELRETLAQTQRALDELAAEQQAAGRWRQLLYETGDALEVVVRDALATLGAAVTEPAAAGREDGRLTDGEGRQALIEIKGVRGPIKLDHVRQLRQWTDDALANEGLDAKGLLVANAFAATPPPERGQAVSGDTLRLAERWQQCLLTTPQLFAALVADQDRRLDRDAFWRTVFEANGLADLPDLRGAVG